MENGVYPKMMLEKYGKIWEHGKHMGNTWETYGKKAESPVGFRDTPSTKPMVTNPFPRGHLRANLGGTFHKVRHPNDSLSLFINYHQKSLDYNML